MQIRASLLSFVIVFCLPILGITQSTFEREILSLAEEVAAVANEHLMGQNIAIGDILDSDGNTVELGKLLADELSYALSGQRGNFKIVDRSHFKTLMDEIDKRALLDDKTVLKLGKIVGISVVVYGKIYRQSDHYRIFLKYAILEKQVIDNLCRGRLTRVPSVDAMFQPNPVKAQDETNPSMKSLPAIFPPYQEGNINIQFNGCKIQGDIAECTYSVKSIGRNETFFAYCDGTYLQQGYRNSAPVSLYMSNQQSSYQLSVVLEANKPIVLTLQFRGFSGATTSSINLHARTPATFDFNYLNTNFTIK